MDAQKIISQLPENYLDSSLCLLNCGPTALCIALYNTYQPLGYELPSREFIYYNARFLDDNLDPSVYGSKGAPCRLSSCIKAVEQYGIVSEKDWPSTKDIYIKPPIALYKKASIPSLGFKKIEPNRKKLVSVINRGQVVIAGLMVTQTFWQHTGPKQLKVPGIFDFPLEGHAVVLISVDSEKGYLIYGCHGLSWGDQGFAYLPFDYLEHPELIVHDSLWTVTDKH